MAIDLMDIAVNEATTPVKVFGESMNITFKPALITAAIIEDLERSSDSDAINTFLCDILTKWDLTSAGAPVPLTPEGLKPVPLVVLKAVLMAIVEATGAGEAEGLSNDG